MVDNLKITWDNKKMADAQLKALLNAAKKKPCNFVLAAKGADVALILSRKKIAAAQIKEAKIQVGGGKAYIGILEAGSDGFTFKSANQMPGGILKPLRQYIKRETGITISAELG
jgi:hypothetical protein